MKVQARMIIAPKLPNENLERHYNYMTYLFTQHDKLDEENIIEVEYRNYLQSPLQPLADNLESTTYETFEKDSIKYELYE
jgi:type II protein arginine methyltransferase